MPLINGSTTEIEAVNEMLEYIGYPPVDTIEDTFEAQQAYKQLIRTSREVQSRGYNFNSEYNKETSTDENREILYPEQALRVDSSNRYNYDITRRDGKLYDRRAHTFKLSEDVGGTINLDFVWNISFEDLPETPRRYICLKATKAFMAKYHGEGDLISMIQEDIAVARAEMMHDEISTGDYNMLDSEDSGSVFYDRYADQSWGY